MPKDKPPKPDGDEEVYDGSTPLDDPDDEAEAQVRAKRALRLKHLTTVDDKKKKAPDSKPRPSWD